MQQTLVKAAPFVILVVASCQLLSIFPDVTIDVLNLRWAATSGIVPHLRPLPYQFWTSTVSTVLADHQRSWCFIRPSTCWCFTPTLKRLIWSPCWAGLWEFKSRKKSWRAWKGWPKAGKSHCVRLNGCYFIVTLLDAILAWCSPSQI